MKQDNYSDSDFLEAEGYCRLMQSQVGLTGHLNEDNSREFRKYARIIDDMSPEQQEELRIMFNPILLGDRKRKPVRKHIRGPAPGAFS